MPEESRTPGSIRFGPFELLPETQELRKHGLPVKLSGQAIQVLLILTACPGKLVTREELQRKLWPGDSFGDFDRGLNAAVSKLREKLSDSATEPKYVETLPGRGYRFVGKVESASDLENRAGDMPPVAGAKSNNSETTTTPPTTRRWRRKVLAGLAACVVVSGSLYGWMKPRIERFLRLYELQKLTVVPLTTSPGVATSPTFSPDGSQVAFVWDGGDSRGGGDLYVKTIGNDKPLRLTHGGQYGMAAWSPDGQSIALNRCAASDCEIVLIPPLGGPERKIASGGCCWMSWSPDGRHLAALDHPANSPSDETLKPFVLSLDSGEKAFFKTDCNVVQTLAFSPGGKYLAWTCADNLSSMSVYMKRIRDGMVTQLLKGIDGISGLAWSRDERRIVFTTSTVAGDLWEVALTHPDLPEKLPLVHDAFEIAVSSSRNRLAFAQYRTNTNIWRLDLSIPHPQPEKVVSSTREQASPNISPDGTQIAF